MTPLQASYPPMMIFIGIILSIIYTSPSLMISKILTATSISIVSLAGLSGGTFFPPLFRHIMDKMGDFKIIDNIHVYNASNYHYAMWIVPITLLIALMATFFIRETYCQASEH
jgi:hypothetical protein